MANLIQYFEALERLKKNRPLIVPPGTRITKDAVALEAGRGRGAIKNKRETFAELVDAIASAARIQSAPVAARENQVRESREKMEMLRSLYEASLNREVMLIKRIFELEARLARGEVSNVRNIFMGP